MRQAKIFIDNQIAGILTENDEGYLFKYDANYLAQKRKRPVSLTIPLQEGVLKSEFLFPFLMG